MGPSVAVAALQILLGAVSLVTAAKPRHMTVPRTDLSHPCSRALSRTVRQRFQRHVARRLKGGQRNSTSRNWPDGCPFSPWVDIFGWHEKNKTRSKSEWVCNYTGKIFKSEHYIDLHMETNFMKVAPENGVCLADYCEVFGFCNVVEPTFFESLSAEPPPCDLVALEKHKRICESVCDRCALVDDPEMPQLNADLHRSLCEPLTCEFLAAEHHSNRKWCIVGGVSLAGFVVIIILCCACAPAPEPYQRSYGKDQRYRNASKRTPSGSRDHTVDIKNASTDIYDIIPTIGKPVKQE